MSLSMKEDSIAGRLRVRLNVDAVAPRPPWTSTLAEVARINARDEPARAPGTWSGERVIDHSELAEVASVEARSTARIIAATLVRPVVTLHELESELLAAEGVAAFGELGMGPSIYHVHIVRQLFMVAPAPGGRAMSPPPVTTADFIAFLVGDPVACSLLRNGVDAGGMADAFARSRGFQRGTNIGIHISNFPALLQLVAQERARFDGQLALVRTVLAADVRRRSAILRACEKTVIEHAGLNDDVPASSPRAFQLTVHEATGNPDEPCVVRLRRKLPSRDANVQCELVSATDVHPVSSLAVETASAATPAAAISRPRRGRVVSGASVISIGPGPMNGAPTVSLPALAFAPRPVVAAVAAPPTDVSALPTTGGEQLTFANVVRRTFSQSSRPIPFLDSIVPAGSSQDDALADVWRALDALPRPSEDNVASAARLIDSEEADACRLLATSRCVPVTLRQLLPETQGTDSTTSAQLDAELDSVAFFTTLRASGCFLLASPDGKEGEWTSLLAGTAVDFFTPHHPDQIRRVVERLLQTPNAPRDALRAAILESSCRSELEAADEFVRARLAMLACLATTDLQPSWAEGGSVWEPLPGVRRRWQHLTARRPIAVLETLLATVRTSLAVFFGALDADPNNGEADAPVADELVVPNPRPTWIPVSHRFVLSVVDHQRPHRCSRVVFSGDDSMVTHKFARLGIETGHFGVFRFEQPPPRLLQAFLRQGANVAPLEDFLHTEACFRAVGRADSAGFQAQFAAVVPWAHALVAGRFPTYYRRHDAQIRARLGAVQVSVVDELAVVHTLTFQAATGEIKSVFVRVPDARGAYLPGANSIVISRRCMDGRAAGPVLARAMLPVFHPTLFDKLVLLFAAAIGSPNVAAAVKDLEKEGTIFRLFNRDVESRSFSHSAWEIPHAVDAKKYQSTFPPGTGMISSNLRPVEPSRTMSRPWYDATLARGHEEQAKRLRDEAELQQRAPPQPPAERRADAGPLLPTPSPDGADAVAAPEESDAAYKPRRRYTAPQPPAPALPPDNNPVPLKPSAAAAADSEPVVEPFAASDEALLGFKAEWAKCEEELIRRLQPTAAAVGGRKVVDRDGNIRITGGHRPAVRADASVLDADALRNVDAAKYSAAAELFVTHALRAGQPMRPLEPGERRLVEWVHAGGESGRPYDVLERIVRISDGRVLDQCFYEVKSTTSVSKLSFELSLRELLFAAENPSRFVIARVFHAQRLTTSANAITAPRITFLRDPLAAYRSGRLVIKASIEAIPV